MESSLWSHNFSVAYAVKFFGPSGSLAVENKPNKVRTRFFRFSAVRHVPARRAISPGANSLSLRALAGRHRWRLAAIPGCLMCEFNGGCTAADGCRDSRPWQQRSSRLTNRAHLPALASSPVPVTCSARLGFEPESSPIEFALAD